MFVPGTLAQSIMCLAADMCLVADLGVASLIPALSHTFLENDHEIISMAILFPSPDLRMYWYPGSGVLLDCIDS